MSSTAPSRPKRYMRKGSLPFDFVAIPDAVVRHPEFRSLKSGAKALLLDLMLQYSGKNNGSLMPGMETMRRYGWKSKAMLVGAKKELLRCPFVIQTKQGHPPDTPELLGVTWFRLDWHPSMDWRDPKAWPFLNFIEASPPPTREELYAKWREPDQTANPVVLNPDRSRPKRAGKRSESGPISVPKIASSVPNQDHATEVAAKLAIGPESGEVLEVAISDGAAEPNGHPSELPRACRPLCGAASSASGCKGSGRIDRAATRAPELRARGRVRARPGRAGAEG